MRKKYLLEIKKIGFRELVKFSFLLVVFLGIQEKAFSMPACVVIAPVPNDACYQTVITNDTYCCNTAWDALCQNAYNACVPPPPPLPGTINMTNGSSAACTGFFYDSGGAGANYANNQNFTYTICSDVPGNQIVLNFTAFNTENFFDVLTIYNGPSTASPIIGSYTGGAGPGMVTSTGTCLTLVFTSDGSVISTGWAATISCVPPPPPPCGTPTTFNFTGGIQNFVVPAGVTSLVVVVEGAQGGGAGGANGATVTGSITVVPGQTLQIVVGGQGACPGAGFGGGGSGQNSSIAGYQGCGGGGASYISAPPGGMGNALAVAGGGGGEGGGDDYGMGGVGGCGSGGNGTSPFGIGGSGGTSVSGGAGGPPWTAGGGTGQPGSFGQGGNGGLDVNFGYAPGGGGGGGYYGGGGGGSDNIGMTTAIGGGGGGGGSSLTPPGGGCTQGNSAGSGSITIYIPTPNTMTSANAATICSGGTVNIPLTSTIAGSTFTWIAAANANVTGESTVLQTSSTLNNTLVNTTTVPQTVTYTVTPTGPAPGFCIGTAQTVNVIVNPAPTMTSATTQAICSGGAVNIPLTSNVPGTTFTWVATPNGSVTGESTIVQNTSTINNTLTNTTAAVQTVTYTVTPTGPAPSFCVGTPQTVTVTLNPNPLVTSPNNQAICSGGSVNIPLTSNIAGTTFSWIATPNGNVTGESTTAQTTSIINNTLTNTTAAVQTVTYTVTPTGPAPSFCVGNNQTVTITINPNPIVTSPNAQTICSGTAVNIPLTSNIVGTTFSWIATANPNVTGESTTAQTTALINNNLVNTTAVAQVVTYTVTPTGPAPSFCVGTIQTVNITVNPTPSMTSSNAQTICSGTAVNIPLTSNVAGATYSWIAADNPNVTGESTTAQVTALINNNLVNTSAVPQVVTYTVTPTGPAPSLCPGTPQLVNITVNPTPTMTSPNAQNICSGTAVNIPLTSNVTGSTFSWIAAANPNVTGESTTVQATGTINDNLVNTTTAVQTVTYTVTPTGPAPSLCPGTPQTVTVTINPTPVMTSPAAQTICSGTAVNIPLTSNVAGSTFSWIAAANPNVTGESTTAQATALINNNLVNTTTVVQTVTYTVTPTGPAPSLCPGIPQIVTVTINPTPVMTSPNAQTICSGTAVNIPLTSGVAGSTFSWIATANPNVTGESTTAQTTGTINNTLTNTTAVVQTVTYTVTPTGPAPSLCPGTPQTVTVTVNPSPPIVVVGVSPTTCGGNNGTITISGLAATTNYNISYNNPGLVGPVVMMSNGAGVITITGLTAGTYTGFIADAAGCASTSATIITLVDPNPPIVNDPADQTLCANVGTTAVNFTGTVGATFTWVNNTPSIGLVAGGVGNIASFVATNATALPVTATITVTPSLAGCTGTPQTFTITVNPIPTVNDPADQSLCANSLTTAVNFTGTAGATFNWANSNVTIGLVAAGSGNIGSFTGLNATPGTTNTGTITVTPVLAGCTGTAQTFTISVVNTLPTLNCPGNLLAVCSITEQPAYANFAAFTGAGGTANSVGGVIQPATFILVSQVSNGGTCPEIFTRTYSIQDNCGVTATCTQTITVDDNINPTGTAPANVTVQCIANVPVANPALITDEADNCAPPVVAFVSDVSNGGTCPEIITRTYSITDACGNTINVTQIITIDDTTNPTASNPANFNGSAVPPVDVTVVIDEADNCSVPVVAFVSDVTDGLNCPETIVRTYSVTDACGNQILVTQQIIIGDPFPPTASNPAPVAVQCVALVPVANPAVVTDEADNNGVPVVAFVSDVSDGNTCPETITRTYSVTDICGNQILVTQTITVDDNINPTGTAPANITVQCIADVPASNVALITDEADNCAVPTVTFIGDVSNGLTCPETITRTYRITDACGNFIDVTQSIIVDDTTNPTASNPVGVTVQCIGDVPASDPTVVIDEADNCSVPIVAFVSDVSDGNICPETITRTYSVTDACGNTINVTQTIVIHDTTNPTASNPATIVVPGGPVPVADPLDVIDEADNCSVPTVVFVSDVSDGNLCPETITRTYSVTDDCGNTINVTQIIQITDPIMPTASNPITVNVECIGDVPASDVLVVTDEADNNGTPIVVYVGDISDGLNCPETITRTYSVTDACGNQILVTQLIIVNDITLPTASNPIGVIVQCIGDVPASDILVVTDEADNCTVNPVVAFVGDVSDGNTCPETITRTYSITDDCGNSINVTQSIIVDDTTNPTASNPAGVTVQCIGDVPLPDPTVVNDEADNCSVPIVAFVNDVSDGNTCPETITRTYSVTDACGNVINVTQTIIVDDTTDPTASNPAGVTVDIIANVPIPDPLVVIDEADNCSVPVVAFVSDLSDGNSCPETITRTYSITDACGNQITVSQIIIVSDIILPTASNPITVNVECIGQVPAPDALVVIDEVDNSGVPVVAFVSDVSDGLSCPETITRTYSVTDACNNQILVTQLIIVNDITVPTASNPVGVTVQCIGDVPASDVLVVTDEADNCTVNPVVAFVGDVSDGNTCPETITRTYSVTDDCGNTINVTQTIIVDDTTNPTASNPVGVTVQCIADVPAPDPTVVIDEVDNCSVPVVTFGGDVSNNGTCPEIITRTYNVTDECGNTFAVTQTITIMDDINPTALNPAPINVMCAFNVPVPDPSVVTTEADNCTANPIVTWESDVSGGVACNNEMITRTYRITDACGNFIDVTQQINIGVSTPTVNAGLDQAVCDGEQVTLTASNPDAAVITWDNGIVNSSPFTPSLGTTVYTVTASQCLGECTSTDQVTVVVNPLPVIAFVADTLIGCAPLEVQFTNQSSILGNNCQWIFGDGNSAIGCDSVINIYNTTGIFDVTLTVTTLEGCTSTDTYNSYITIADAPVAEFTFSPTYVSVENTEVQFENFSINADDYVWNFGDNLVGSYQTNPSHTFPAIGNMSYTVTLTATNYAGCIDTATAIVTIEDVIIFYVPNVFTPDGNNINNTFFPVFTSGFDVYDYHLTIFNRWGEVLFESYDATVGWSGTYGNEGLVEDGVYVWQIEFGETMSDKRHKERGHVTVLK